ncbi:MAG: MBOAT family protein [Lachnospiraceae bacterium]|nr:MBOAT family protein [Lachnospiraceae bacterium]
MLFNSLAYAIFLPIVFFVYWLIPNRFRWCLLLVASYYFYMSWNPKYILLIMATTVVSYLCALAIERTDSVKIKKMCIAAAVVLSGGILFTFKYLGFVIENLAILFSNVAIPLGDFTKKLVLPVGISFYTFQTMSYVIDVYRGKVKAEKNLGIYATFVSFFPQLVAGPIERTGNLLPQIKAEHKFDEDKASYGMILIVVGLFKKLVIADMLSVYVDTVFNSVDLYKGGTLLLAAFFFTIQIYCDFSGYSDIAIGSAKLLDIDLMTNFSNPYFSSSISEFWSRWHISLSTWFKDYIYIPLGGNRKGKVRRDVNLLTTFMVSGIWHGANWTFLLWGGVHGASQIVEKHIKSIIHCKNKILSRVGKCFGRILTFVVVMFAWVLFRANSISDAWYIYRNVFSGIISIKTYIMDAISKAGISGNIQTLYILLCILVLAIYDGINYYRGDVVTIIRKQKPIVRFLIYIIAVVALIIMARKDIAAQFVYFQF